MPNQQNKTVSCRTAHRKNGSTYVWCRTEGEKRNHCRSIKDPLARDACRSMEDVRQRLREADQAYRDAQARCPSAPPHGTPGWKAYEGAPIATHCGYQGFVENKQPSPKNPAAECFYDEKGRMVDDSHPYSGCKGTANQFSAYSDPLRHLFLDKGGPVVTREPFLGTSLRHLLSK